MVDTADLDAQIAALQAARQARLDKAEAATAKDKVEKARTLVGGTPTKPTQPKAAPPPRPPQPKFGSAGPSRPRTLGVSRSASSSKSSVPALPPSSSRPSKLSASLAARRPRTSTSATAGLTTLSRSTSFTSKPAKPVAVAPVIDEELEVYKTGAERGADLTLDVELPLGPKDFGKDPEGGDEWREVEPNSELRLAKRTLPHSEVQDLLYGRYFVRPSQIYSVARLSRDGATYDIPVEGDWVTIAVVAERSDIKVSGTKTLHDGGEDDGSSSEDEDAPKAKKPKASKGKPADRRQRVPRKYVNLKLVSLPPRHKLGSGGGDAVLQLLLFESEAVVKTDSGKEYRGGSGGAYEKWCNLAVGSVVALLNPRVLRPLKNGGATPHPLNLPLALNPQSDKSITLLGHSADMGTCVALGRDGKRCGTWVDKRVNTVCDYHLHAAIKRTRSKRAEFAGSTTPFELETRFTGKKDKARSGLLPMGPGAAPRGLENGGGGATYVVGSKVARTGSAYGKYAVPNVGERMGSGQVAKRRRKAELAASEQALQAIFDRVEGKRDAPTEQGKRVFSAEVVRKIGYNPTGLKAEDKGDRAAIIESLKKAADRPMVFGSFRRSNVIDPTKLAAKEKEGGEGDEDMIDL